ncbi:DUF55-domain-containing protein [Delitschia confertaspora ATCC 74209]|uniref:Thymocyte nuclear protein 1 n=1 Tax=Delitschia confertaspora ATCC 74209 TaxID=1513339 RepID=A0A9P4JKG2_9PLEO|nr:DUF55-domain-containing protein [Delitschia confertaspora ATCC 74209]
MAATRKSTRIANATFVKESEEKTRKQPDRATISKPKVEKATRRKRARDDGEEDVNRDGESSPKPKKQHLPAAKLSTSRSKSAPTTSSSSPSSTSHEQSTFWLLKAEPDSRIENGIDVKFSIDDLAACTAPEPWTGVRNYQARNNMMAMKKGDLGLFYHSNTKVPGIVGVLRVVGEAVVDESAFDPKDPYFDPKSDREKPKWFCVSVEFVRKFPRIIDLQAIKGLAGKGGPLENMQLVKGARLSVSRVEKEEWEYIMRMADNMKEDHGDVGGIEEEKEEKGEKRGRKGRKPKK